MCMQHTCDRYTDYFDARRVEYVARRTDWIERNKQQRSAVVDSIVADADQIAANWWNGAFDGAEADEKPRPTVENIQPNIAGFGHLSTATTTTTTMPWTKPGPGRTHKPTNQAV